jgi:hypothetical protein
VNVCSTSKYSWNYVEGEAEQGWTCKSGLSGMMLSLVLDFPLEIR